jgi:hypothetical protein
MTPETFVILGSMQWGYGPTLDAAKRRWRTQGRGKLSDGYGVYTFGEGSTFEGVDNLGRVHWSGERPAFTEVPARTRKAC